MIIISQNDISLSNIKGIDFIEYEDTKNGRIKLFEKIKKAIVNIT